jgi:penicillin amidase
MTSRRARTVVIVLGVLIVLAVVAGLLGVQTVRRSFPQTAGTLRVPGLEHPVEVVRDAMGVPSIYAQTMHDLMMAQGFVQAQDRFWQMDVSRHIGTGRLAEMFGEGQVDTDLFLRTLGWARVAQQEWDATDAGTRAYLEAYADGVNAYLAQHSGSALSLEYAVMGLINSGYEPEAWMPIHTITWGKAMAWDLGGNMDTEIARSILDKELTPEVLALLYPPYPADNPIITEPSGAVASGGSSPTALPDEVQPLLAAVGSRVDSLSTLLDANLEGIGSNNWVIAGSRTTTGGPLLANDMHLSIQMPSIWYEMGLHCQPVTDDCPLDVVGFTFPGVPGVVVGHNADIAWGVTNGGPDVQDLYIEKINPENPNQYEVNGQWVDMTLVEDTIQVAGGGSVPLTVRYTRHGPIISDTYGPLKDTVEAPDLPFRQRTGLELPANYAIALRWTALEAGRLFHSLRALDQVSDFEGFQAALCDWTVPSQNFVYADLRGNIGYQYTGRIPVRASGDGSRPVPGWTDEYEWAGDIPCNRMPSVYNPPAGYVATANHAVVGSDYGYPMPNGWDYGYRGARIVEMITAKDKLSVEDLQTIHGDDYHAMGPVFVPLLTAMEGWATPNQAIAADLLGGWDYQNRIDSAPAAVFNAFWRHLLLRLFTNMGVPEDYFPDQDRAFAIMETLVGASGWDCASWCDDPTTPGIEDREAVLQSSFADAVTELETILGKDPVRWTWGALHTATFRNTTLGESGIGPIEALFNRGPYETAGGDSIVNATSWDYREGYEVVFLPSERMIVNLANLPDSLMVHTTGQSGHAYHPHYADMINAWRLIEYEPMLWSRDQVEAAAPDHLTLTP